MDFHLSDFNLIILTPSVEKHLPIKLFHNDSQETFEFVEIFRLVERLWVVFQHSARKRTLELDPRTYGAALQLVLRGGSSVWRYAKFFGNHIFFCNSI
jgi:hypothetical protein